MPRFSEDFIRRVREANDIAQVVESYSISMRRTGTNFVALCPFHNEKTPSFNINPVQQFFKCFGCDAKGDVITFVRMMERVEFAEAVELLAQRAGLKVEYERGGGFRREEEKDYEARKALFWINSKTLQYFEEMLQSPSGRQAKEYLLERGFSEDTIRDWRLGWSPDSWDGLINYIVGFAGEAKREKIYQAGLAAGVFRQKEGGNAPYDAFRGRVMFPIFDMQNRPIGFGGRVLEEKPEAGGKYINTSEGRLFEKRKLLFGLNFAAKEIGLKREVVVVEGYTDTIMCHQSGLRNVVATLGTSLTREHIQKLRRYVQQGGKVIALFDADDAGERATDRAVRLFMEEDLPLAVARGLTVKDACEFLPKFGADEFRKELGQARSSFNFALEKEINLAGDDLNLQSVAVDRIMELVNSSPNRVKREMMRKEVAQAFRVPDEALPRPKPKREPRGGLLPDSSGVQESFTSESKPSGILPSLVKRDEGRKKLEMRLLQYMLESEEWSDAVADELPPEEFFDPAAEELAARIRDCWHEGRRPDIARLKGVCVVEGADQLAVDILMPGHEHDFSRTELEQLLAKVVERRLRKEMEDIVEDIRVAERENDRERLDRLILRKLELNKDISKSKGGVPQP